MRITEWLPVSSTGHMILFEQFIHMNVSKDFWDMFVVVIQFGSILAVVLLYFHKLNPFSPSKSPIQKKRTWSLWGKVLVGIIPLGLIGLPFDDLVTGKLYGYVTVAIALIVYGIAFIVVENRNCAKKRLCSSAFFRCCPLCRELPALAPPSSGLPCWAVPAISRLSFLSLWLCRSCWAPAS